MRVIYISNVIPLNTQAESLFDGFRDTGRASATRSVAVSVGTLDAEWQLLGRPEIPVIKCDVEGAELDVLEGARECLGVTRAAVLVEWSANNLATYQRAPEAILEFARSCRVRAFAVPCFGEITDAPSLRLQMIETKSFLLAR